LTVRTFFERLVQECARIVTVKKKLLKRKEKERKRKEKKVSSEGGTTQKIFIWKETKKVNKSKNSLYRSFPCLLPIWVLCFVPRVFGWLSEWLLPVFPIRALLVVLRLAVVALSWFQFPWSSPEVSSFPAG